SANTSAPRKTDSTSAASAGRTSGKLSFASPRITTLGSGSVPTAVRSASPNWSAATCQSSIHSLPASSMETRIRPLSSPWLLGFAVFGRFTSGPFRICGAITMKIISNTSTTSTSGVMLIAACNLAGSPSRIGFLLRIGHRYLDLLYDLRLPKLPVHDLRHFEQAVHKLGRDPVHLYMESFYFPGEVVKGDYGRNRDEDAQGRRDQGFGDAARDHR